VPSRLRKIEVGAEIVRSRHRVEYEVEPAGLFLHLRVVARDDDLVGAEALAVGDLPAGRREKRHMRAHGVRELQRHVSEPVEADDPDFLPRPHPPWRSGE
jgi:hypothetical protein